MSKGITNAYQIKAIDSAASSTEYGDAVTVDLTNLMDVNAVLSSIRILSTRIPLLCWNIMDKNGWSNTKMRINVGGDIQLIILDQGYYSGAQLLNALMTEITAAYSASGYSCFIDWDERGWQTTIVIQDGLGINQNFEMRSEVEKPSEDEVFIPSILQLLGFGEQLPTVWPIVYTYTYTGADTYTSEGSLNIFQDRSVLITCDQIEGTNTNLNDPGPESWSDGIVASLPFKNHEVGDVMDTDLYNDAMRVRITSKGSTRQLIFRLARSRYPYFGPPMIAWEMLLEIN